MAVHKYKIGQTVSYSPGRSAMAASSREYKIIRLLPPEDGQNLYRIKGISETFERMARESDLSRK
jgi:hypothetical protein